MSRKGVAFRQCVLEKKTGRLDVHGGVRVQTAWIPERFAVLNRPLKLSGDDGWIVKHVSEVRLTEDERAVVTERQYWPSIEG